MQIREAAIASHDYAGMGTTIVAARVTDGRLSVAHVGDSRLYLFAGGALRQVTQDDSWMASMLANDPNADPLLLRASSRCATRSRTSSARGRGPRSTSSRQTLAGGELLLLSTDGVHGVLDERRIEQMLMDEEDPRAIAHAMISAALTRGSRDNCTAVVARYTSVAGADAQRADARGYSM